MSTSSSTAESSFSSSEVSSLGSADSSPDELTVAGLDSTDLVSLLNVDFTISSRGCFSS